MSLAYCVVVCLANLLATPALDIWDFKHFLPEEYLACRVLAVSKSAIMVSSSQNGDGFKINQVVTFPFHHRLASGSFNRLAIFEAYCYTRDDVRAGDRIDIHHRVFQNNTDYCVEFRIRERPGGPVPPSRRYRIGDFQPHHERANAFAAERNDKIPLPRHLGIKVYSGEYPAFDLNVPRKERIAAWPTRTPFSYVEYIAFMR